MNRTHRKVLNAMRLGATLWRYSTHRRGWLLVGNDTLVVNRSTIDAMEEAGLIEEDEKESFYRGHGSDLRYRVVEAKAQLS